jgi:hypothetical protein
MIYVADITLHDVAVTFMIDLQQAVSEQCTKATYHLFYAKEKKREER